MSKYKKIAIATAKLLLVCAFTGFNILPAQAATTKTIKPSTNFYTIQLPNAKYFGNLVAVADSIHHLFIGNQNSQFKNIYTFHTHLTFPELRESLKGEFTYLDPQGRVSAAGIVTNDPYFTNDPQNIDKQWALAKAGFDVAWQKTTGDKSNIVAIIDTGVDETHQDLKSINFLPGFDFVNQQIIPTGTNSDDNGHGTLVAGVLGATPNNGIGIVGTNWQISVLPIKALDTTGKGDVAVVSQAIVWAADHGAQFINLSLGGIGFGHDSTLANAISYAFNKNVLVVAAAGNDTSVTAQSLDQDPVFPVCDDNNYNMVLGVTATTQNDLKKDTANYGKNCIDVAAPGDRILSTISFDPLTKKSAPNSYVYASGTSLAVPYVVGQAALIRSLYPTATNIQIRDRIITTATPVDDLNLTQCGGASCRGLIGSGRIDVPKSLQIAISQNFSEGDLIKVSDLSDAIYEIVGGQKRLVSPFVFNQRFTGQAPKAGVSSELAGFPEGSYVTPTDGTLVKLDGDNTVYIMNQGQKLPLTYQVFLQRNFSFSNVNTLSYSELNSWPTGNFYPPIEGTVLKTATNKTVYWVVGQVLHPVNYNFFIDHGLNVFPIMVTSDTDVAGFPMGDAYIR